MVVSIDLFATRTRSQKGVSSLFAIFARVHEIANHDTLHATQMSAHVYMQRKCCAYQTIIVA